MVSLAALFILVVCFLDGTNSDARELESEIKLPTSSLTGTSVIVVGAGAAGLYAGYKLDILGADYTILEASSVIGGRVRKLEGFADFPIDLGAEWVHDDTDATGLLKSLLINGESLNTRKFELIEYFPLLTTTTLLFIFTLLRPLFFLLSIYPESKYLRSTWFDFVETYFGSVVYDNVVFDAVVSDLAYDSASGVTVTTSDSTEYTADYAIVAVPLQILQDGDITFSPSLPTSTINSIYSGKFAPGFKVFIEFSFRFYPTDHYPISYARYWWFSDVTESYYYNGAFGKDSEKNIFAGLVVGAEARQKVELNDDRLFDAIMQDLDRMFYGMPSLTYEKHVIQNWSAEPYIRGAYSFYGVDDDSLKTPVEDRVFFAGEHIPPSHVDVSTVHGAARSGGYAVDQIVSVV